MIKLTNELEKLIDDCYPWSTWQEKVTFIYWDIFVPKRRNMLIEKLKLGCNWMYAFKCAKELK